MNTTMSFKIKRVNEKSLPYIGLKFSFDDSPRTKYTLVERSDNQWRRDRGVPIEETNSSIIGDHYKNFTLDTETFIRWTKQGQIIILNEVNPELYVKNKERKTGQTRFLDGRWY